MKLRVYKSHLQNALLWYTDQLYEKHIGTLLTPARVELIRRDLEVLQEKMKKNESNSAWHVPVGLSIDSERNKFEVVVTDESNLLYVDVE